MRGVVILKEPDFFDIASGFLFKGVSVRFHASGWSMRPYVQDGDIVKVSPVGTLPVKRGDIVLYSTADDRLIAHRIIKKIKRNGATTFLIKGDATLSGPENVDGHHVLGKVVEIERHGRKRNLESKRHQITNLILSGISPISRWIYPIGGRIKGLGRKISGDLLEILQTPKIYRVLARKLKTTDIQYQVASSEDAVSLYRLVDPDMRPGEDSFLRAFEDRITNPKDSGFWVVAKTKGKIVGSANLCKFPESDGFYAGWWIHGMKVNWRYRGLGIGEKLLLMAEEIAVKAKASEIRLLVFEDARPAYNLYRKMGFRRISIPLLDRQLEEETKTTSRRRIALAKDLKATSHQKS